MMVSRHVVGTMIGKMPDIVDRNISGHPGRDSLKDRLLRCFDPLLDDRGVKLSEDLAFCERWRRCGGEVWANVNHLIGHIGPFNYCIRYADYLEGKAKEQAAAA
jgi:hypothetical protein